MRLCVLAVLSLFVFTIGCSSDPPVVNGSEAVANLRDLPLLEFPAKNPTAGAFAVLLTGDGGWRRIDKRLTTHLNEAGISVVGMNTPVYFKRERPPEEAARDLERVIAHYSREWNKDRVILCGYSRGADVLPFIATHLSSETMNRVAVIALMGVEADIEFRFVPMWYGWFGIRTRDKLYKVAPEIEKLRGKKILCFYGEHDDGDICRAMDRTLVIAIREPGSHHFAGNYAGIARDIIAAASR